MLVSETLSYASRPFVPIGRWALLLVDAFSTPGEYRKYRYHLFRQMVQIGLARILGR